MSCYGCRNLIQGSDGSNGCLKFGEPGHEQYPYPLDDENPEPLYSNCYDEARAALEGK